jgi:hypothetical protein
MDCNELFPDLTLGAVLELSAKELELSHRMKLHVSLKSFRAYILGESTLELSKKTRGRLDVLSENFRAYRPDNEVIVTDERPDSQEGPWYFRAGLVPDDLDFILDALTAETL